MNNDYIKGMPRRIQLQTVAPPAAEPRRAPLLAVEERAAPAKTHKIHVPCGESVVIEVTSTSSPRPVAGSGDQAQDAFEILRRDVLPQFEGRLKMSPGALERLTSAQRAILLEGSPDSSRSPCRVDSVDLGDIDGDDQYGHITDAELREDLRDQGLKTTGTRQDLINRIEGHPTPDKKKGKSRKRAKKTKEKSASRRRKTPRNRQTKNRKERAYLRKVYGKDWWKGPRAEKDRKIEDAKKVLAHNADLLRAVPRVPSMRSVATIPGCGYPPSPARAMGFAARRSQRRSRRRSTEAVTKAVTEEGEPGWGGM